MEIKILCHCGTKYKFDVEPVGGRVPMAIQCPNCGVDATDFANAFIQQQLGTPAPAVSPESAPMASLIPSPPEAATSAADTSESPRLKLNVAKPAVSEPSVAAPEPEEAARPAPPAHVRASLPVPISDPDATDMRLFTKCALGALVGTLVGVIVYYMVFKLTGARVKLLAIGVGYLAGLGTQLMGKEGSKELGLVTAMVVLFGLFGVQYMMGAEEMKESIDEITGGISTWYDEEVAFAKETVAQIPYGTEEEIRAYLAKDYYGDDDEDEDDEAIEGEAKFDPASIPMEEIDYFKTNRLVELQALANGEVTREEFNKELELDKVTESIDEFEKSPGYKMILIVKSLSVFNIICMIGGVGLAYRMSANA